MTTAAPSRRPKVYAPGEFSAALADRYGIAVSVRWVQEKCRRRKIKTLAAFGRWYIPQAELDRVGGNAEARA